jgi:CHAT domain-containing protein
VCDVGKHQHWDVNGRRKNLSVARVCVFLLLLISFGCSSKHSDPGVALKQINASFSAGNLVAAREQAHKASEDFSKYGPEWQARFRLLEAEALAYQGLSRDSLALLRIGVPPNLQGDDLRITDAALKALVFDHLGDTAEADENLQRALRMCASWNCASAGKLARIAGAIATERAAFDQAQGYFETTREIAKKQGDEFLECTALLNLGVVALGRERFDEAIDWSEQAGAVAQKINAAAIEEKASGNLGWAYYKTGDFARSLDAFKDAIDKAQRLGAIIDEVEWLNNLGLVTFQNGEYAQAGQYYRQSLELAEQSQNQSQIADASTSLAFLCIAQKELNCASHNAGRSLELAKERSDRSGELYASLAQGEIAALAHDEITAEKIFLQVGRDPGSDTSARWEAQNSLAKLYESENRAVDANKAYRQALTTVENARSSIQHEDFRLPFLANAAHLYDDYIHFLITHGETIQALQAADYSRAQTLEEGLGLRAKGGGRSAPAEIGDIARKAKATILFYWLGPEHSYLWAINSRETKLVSLPSAADINAMVERYNRVLTAARDPLEVASGEGTQLYDILVKPVEKLVTRDSRVVIIPDGSLGRLNFETLLVPGPQLHYWIDDVTVLTASSLRLLADARQTSLHNGKLLLIGDPALASADYGVLPHASLEIDDIEKHFPASRREVFVHEQATPAAYLASEPERFSLIHFVAHGTASTLSPLDSSVVLSKNDSSDSSFKLYARDVIAHPLHADLVTISSCYGAGTRFYTGEGLIGLAWSFLRAGARNVVGALWAVSDTSTPEFMDDFYGELANGLAPETALRAAKLHMLHSNTVFRKPFYWAPFQLYTGG